ncbi:hypothetical protein IE077_003187 [Cardiosporidium cionae]|uniref:SPRY domain-containing protein n=1 Tax=Cardiosporidium cionae TaxID=476202 RepID=A0ABQ7J8U3_9APIC|nr:hypothetical protein IE077_003187 [Cardiosporidium cionae]|eukprot:KAF8820419.1 hypothetical protein IE077_003187 [Cardiosporidium cionae]
MRKTVFSHPNPPPLSESSPSGDSSAVAEGLLLPRPKKKGRKRGIGGSPVCSTLDDWARRLGVKLYKEFPYPCLDPKYMNSNRSMRLSLDRLSICGTKGWSSILSNVCADHGSWYFEVLVNPHKAWDEVKLFGWEICKNLKVSAEALPHLKEKILPSLRVGWGTRLMKWGAPVGGNPFGYAISQKNGNLFHNGCIFSSPKQISSSMPSSLVATSSSLSLTSLSSTYAPSSPPTLSSSTSLLPPPPTLSSSTSLPPPPPTLSSSTPGMPLPSGTIIGCYLHLPAEVPPWILSDPRMEEKLWTFLKSGLLCNTTNEATLPLRIPFPESCIKFSINGQLLNMYFKDIYCAEYHPCIACFNMGSATLNLGPHFQYPPENPLFRPACEMFPSRYPCKEDLIKCWTYSDEVEEEWTENGDKFLRKKTIAEVEGLYKRQKIKK